VTIRARWVKGFVVEDRDDVSGTSLQGDEPERIGGTNTAPSPLALLSTALAN
jgi:uncharacterized OsmC-like protein